MIAAGDIVTFEGARAVVVCAGASATLVTLARDQRVLCDVPMHALRFVGRIEGGLLGRTVTRIDEDGTSHSGFVFRALDDGNYEAVFDGIVERVNKSECVALAEQDTSAPAPWEPPAAAPEAPRAKPPRAQKLIDSISSAIGFFKT